MRNHGGSGLKKGNLSAETLLIRADASFEIGTGHAMRCLALAQAWQDAGGRVLFAMANTTTSVAARISREGFQYVPVPAQSGSEDDALFTERLGRDREASWIAIDGYGFSNGYQEIVRGSGAKTLVIDDFGGDQLFSANAILNQNLYATTCLYHNRAPATPLLLGTSFALLRREFRGWTQWNRTIPPTASTALVTMGGSDPSGLTTRIMQDFQVAGLSTAFVLGGSTRQRDESLPTSPSLLRDQADMAKLMADSDIAVICCGGTLWECLFMGCATLAYTRDALQERIMKRLEELGAARWLGSESDLNCELLAEMVAEVGASEEARKKMSAMGRKLVDGAGAQRVVEALQRYS